MAHTHIGFIISPGFRVADVVGIQAVLGINPVSHHCHYISESMDVVTGQPSTQWVPTTTFESCPPLDVLVVGELDEASLESESLLAFLRLASAQATHIVGVSSGVTALARAGVLRGRRATAGRKHTPQLAAYGVDGVEAQTFVRDDKFLTAGPSTGAIEAAFQVLHDISGTLTAKLAELTLEYKPTRGFLNVSPQAPDNRGIRVAVLCPPNLYIPDVIGALDVLGSLPNAEVFWAGESTDPAKAILGPTIVPRMTYEDCPDVDVVLVGANMPAAHTNERILRFIRRQNEHNCQFVAVCAGSVLIGAAGVLEGKVAASNFHMTSLLSTCGATPSHDPVVSTGRFHTAGPAIGSYEAALRAVSNIYGPEVAAWIQEEHLEYKPNPVFGVGSPELAGPMLTAISRAVIAPALPLFWWKTRVGYRSNARTALRARNASTHA